MSVGNLKDQGNQGKNFPWQLKMLQALGQLITSSGSTGATLTAILNEIQNDTDDEYLLYYDPTADVFYIGMWSTDDGGDPVLKYYNLDGTGPVVPANPVEPVKGRIHLTTGQRWQCLRDDDTVDAAFVQGDMVEERVLTFYSTAAGSIVLDTAYYLSRTSALLPFTNHAGTIPTNYFIPENGKIWEAVGDYFYDLPLNAPTPAVENPGVSDAWVSTDNALRALVEITGADGASIKYSTVGSFTTGQATQKRTLNIGDVLELVGEDQLTNFHYYDDGVADVKIVVELFN